MAGIVNHRDKKTPKHSKAVLTLPHQNLLKKEYSASPACQSTTSVACRAVKSLFKTMYRVELGL